MSVDATPEGHLFVQNVGINSCQAIAYWIFQAAQPHVETHETRHEDLMVSASLNPELVLPVSPHGEDRRKN